MGSNALVVSFRFKKMAGAGRIIQKYVVVPNVSKKNTSFIIPIRHPTQLPYPTLNSLHQKNHPDLEVNHTIAIAIHLLQQVHNSSMSQSAFDLRSQWEDLPTDELKICEDLKHIYI